MKQLNLIYFLGAGNVDTGILTFQMQHSSTARCNVFLLPKHNLFTTLVQDFLLQSCLVYPHTFIPKVYGRINLMCRLVGHLIIHVIKMVPKQSM